MKIDIDGPDYEVLNSFDGQFEELRLLAARLEVNFFGGPDDWEHTFHNTDRFMRARGFELLGLDVRNYAMAALPSPFAITTPAQCMTGRPFQAEAFYARDPVGEDFRELGRTMSSEKLAKLAAILSVWSQPDGAAEVLFSFRDKLSELLDVDVGIEILAGQAQVQNGVKKALSYQDYIALFESGAPSFYPAPWSPLTRPTLGARLRAAFSAFVEPDANSR